MREFVVNEFIKLQLEGKSTQIYVNDKRFSQCKYLLISIPSWEVREWDHYDSMDEIIKATQKRRDGGWEGGERHAKGLVPEEAFRGHCSNLQAWVENGYNYRILDTRLSIPIIKQILIDLLDSHNKEKAYVYPKDYWKDKFKKFFLDVVESLDDYIKTHLENQYTFGRFEFLYKVLFRTKDIFFTSEEIEGSLALSKVYAYFLPRKQKEVFIRKRSYWERKLWKRTPVVEKGGYYWVGEKYFYKEREAEKYSKNKNLEYRRFLRKIRNATDETSRFYITKSPRQDYLPYLYSKGQFTNERNISFLEIDGELYIRDSNGYYWKQVGNEWKGY